MSKFHFRLATLLRLRGSTRDRRRMELTEARRTEAELQSRLARLDVEREQLQDQRRTAAGPGAVDLPRLVEAHRYAVALKAQEVELQRRRQVLAAEIDRRRRALIEADRDLRALEKLRQNQWQNHRQEELRREGKQLDEATLHKAEVCR